MPSSTIPFLTEGQLEFFLVCNKIIQWCGTVIVLGINSYFINTGPRGLFTTYVEIIVVVSVVAFFPAFIAPFITTPAKEFVHFIDVVFSYLWIMAFIFAALDNNKYNCHSSTPSGVVCSKKWAIEAFIFLTFIFTVFALFLETTSLWLHRRKHQASQPLHEKHRSSSEHDGTAPAEGENSEEPTATSANTV